MAPASPASGDADAAAAGGAVTVSALWIGGPLSRLERLSAASALAQGHAYELYAYGDVPNVPPGVTLRDAAAVLPYDARWDGYRAGFADAFRYKLLHERGGLWLDTDVVLLRPLTTLVAGRERLFARQPSGGSHAVCNNALLAPAGCPLMAELYEEARRGTPDDFFGEMGPQLLTRRVTGTPYERDVVTWRAFNPVPWTHVHLFGEPGAPVTLGDLLADPECLAVHLWSGRWPHEGLSKDGPYSERCLYAALLRRYAESGLTRAELEVTEPTGGPRGLAWSASWAATPCEPAERASSKSA